MKTSQDWVNYFTTNLTKQRIDWSLKPRISRAEINAILPSLQAWQLGETSDGAHLMRATQLYASKIGDDDYPNAVALFIKEEQKHGNNLGRYLDGIKQPRIQKNWGDTLFRKIRYFNTSMELWTLAVITVESAAQVFYQCLKQATNCSLLQQICTDILTDEAAHIRFQQERMVIIFETKSAYTKGISFCFYTIFFFATSFVVWIGHKNLFKAGGTNFNKYFCQMFVKWRKTIGKLLPQTSEKLIHIFG